MKTLMSLTVNTFKKSPIFTQETHHKCNSKKYEDVF